MGKDTGGRTSGIAVTARARVLTHERVPKARAANPRTGRRPTKVTAGKNPRTGLCVGYPKQLLFKHCQFSQAGLTTDLHSVGGRGAFVVELSCCLSEVVCLPTPCAAFPRVCSRGLCLWSFPRRRSREVLTNLLVVSQVSMVSVAGFGPWPRASSVGRPGQLLQRRLHLVVWLGSMPSVLPAVRRELATACDYFRRLHITDISSST